MNDRPKILSIDDNENNQKLIENALTGSYDVETAVSGSTSIEVLSKLNPDAILLDVDMPYIDGLRLCRMIRAEPSFHNTPILFVSALGSHQDQRVGYQAGGDDYIAKPLNLTQLKDKLDHSLRRATTKTEQMTASNDAPALEQSIQQLLDGLIELIKLETAEEVGQHVLATLDMLGLKGAIYLHSSSQTFSSIGPLSDLESLLLQQAKQPYPSEFSARYLWGSDSIGAIIQNMPHAHYDKYQPVVQLISSLLTGADQKLRDLSSRYKGSARSNRPAPSKKGLDRMDTNTLHIHSYKLESSLEQLEQRGEQQLSHLCQQLQAMAKMPSIGITDAQQLLKLADIGLAARLTLYDQCLEIRSHFDPISALIEHDLSTN